MKKCAKRTTITSTKYFIKGISTSIPRAAKVSIKIQATAIGARLIIIKINFVNMPLSSFMKFTKLGISFFIIDAAKPRIKANTSTWITFPSASDAKKLLGKNDRKAFSLLSTDSKVILLFSIGTFCESNIIKEANITANEVAIAVVNKYIPIVFVPSLPNLDVSFIEIIPDITETKIKGKTIILSKIKNKSPIVARMFSMMKLRKMFSTKKIFIMIPVMMPRIIDISIFLVKDITILLS